MEPDLTAQGNIAFIDGQNLHLGTKADGWAVDHGKFRIYLRDKYQINRAYYFIGYSSDQNESLYSLLRKAGFILLFKEQPMTLHGNKRGNVDCDMVFEAMKYLIENNNSDRMYLISGDGDYLKLVNYLILKCRFGKILFPNKNASSLYKELSIEQFSFLNATETKKKIAYA